MGIIHFFGIWEARYDINHTAMTDKAVGYWLRCPFNKTHYSLVDGPLLSDFVGSQYKFNIPKVKASVKETFDGHLNIIGYLWIGFMVSLYFIGKVSNYLKSKRK